MQSLARSHSLYFLPSIRFAELLLVDVDRAVLDALGLHGDDADVLLLEGGQFGLADLSKLPGSRRA